MGLTATVFLNDKIKRPVLPDLRNNALIPQAYLTLISSTSRATQTLSLTSSLVNICRERKKISMPKKTIVASSRGKGLRLALPRPIKQSQSTQESGSSTQQLQSKQKSGSSTQQSPSQSSQQAKQTKADYAFPIQTLMVLQDQRVTKINKKSWAKICSESDEEIDLTQLIAQAAKQKTIIPSPQEKATVETSKHLNHNQATKSSNQLSPHK
ncbi:hypothetical protein PIB30_058145 [Stylosanthes scabra]|uniref:Uncharacterized protein n=1 Tax=Stylosanthes scabra TaxID=79078 RepID=A0ABU6XIJ0_9FABA|nr:hypothetical protein [Stylosanthes scabra]